MSSSQSFPASCAYAVCQESAKDFYKANQYIYNRIRFLKKMLKDV